MHLSYNIKLIRSLANLTLPAFAELFGVKKDVAYTWERKNRPIKPSPTVLDKMAATFGVTVSDLVNKELTAKQIRFNIAELHSEVANNQENSSSSPPYQERYISLLETAIKDKDGTIAQLRAEIEFLRSTIPNLHAILQAVQLNQASLKTHTTHLAVVQSCVEAEPKARRAKLTQIMEQMGKENAEHYQALLKNGTS